MMGIVDYIAIAAIVLIVGAAVFYIIRAKRRGEKCVGCPYAKQCGGNCSGCSGHTEANKDNDKQ
ncbi:MAG: FeoB-associated Cys-rich membrane protein [Clostridia bacterium]|nr:FeoB-associated Cys-rich membrane protein [Clostridia bacterium]